MSLFAKGVRRRLWLLVLCFAAVLGGDGQDGEPGRGWWGGRGDKGGKGGKGSDGQGGEPGKDWWGGKGGKGGKGSDGQDGKPGRDWWGGKGGGSISVERVLLADLVVSPGSNMNMVLTASFRIKERVANGAIDLLQNSIAQTKDWVVLERFASNINEGGATTLGPISRSVPMREGMYYSMRLTGAHVQDFTRVRKFVNGCLIDIHNLADERSSSKFYTNNVWVILLIIFVAMLIFFVTAYVFYRLIRCAFTTCCK